MDTQGLLHAVALTTAKVTDRKGVLQALRRCKPKLGQVQTLLCDSGYVGQPFAQGVRESWSRICKYRLSNAANYTPSRSCLSDRSSSIASSGWKRIENCERTVSE
ncbi:transposase (fragment) [Nitrosomonas mobilis]|uniref:Transposase n=1 Tax=Nitrosomonas mobilis TaxID=51642 RepID=A0A1G5SGS0_9PROT